MKTFEKIEEVSIFIFISFFLLQFREETNKNKTEIDVNNNSNYFKNDLEEIKNNFVNIKSLISQKRKPEDKIDNILEKINNCDNIQIKKENENECDNEDKEEKKETKIKKKVKNKRVKKFIKSIKKISKKSIKIENKNIDSYFDKKGIKQEKDSSVDNINKKFTITHDINNTKNEINAKEYLNKINEEINDNFSILKNNKIKYNSDFLNNINEIPHEIKDFYSLDTKEINEKNKNKYLSILKNYFVKYNSLKNIAQINQINFKNKKLIYIHNCFNKLKKIPSEISKKINPRNYLIKDEYLIDYDKDSEEEYLEQNAEDIIQSNDFEDEEEDIYSFSQQEIKDFLVSDFHLSQSELSDYDVIDQRRLFQKSKSKLIGIKSFLNIRKNYIKPVLIDFTKQQGNDKIMLLSKKLTIGLLNFNNYENNDYENGETFPISFKKKINDNKGTQNSIKYHFKEIIKRIHGSYDTKEHLINELNQKYVDISKNILNNFFKDKCMKVHKKYWIVKEETLHQFNLNLDEMEKIKTENYNKYKEKEEKKAKELEIIIQKDEIIHSKKETTDIEINITDSKDKENIFEITKPQKLDKILINTKEYEGFTIEVLDSESNDSNKNELLDNISDSKPIIDLRQNEDDNLIIAIEKNDKIKSIKKEKKNCKKKDNIFDDEYNFDLHANKRKSNRIKRNNDLKKNNKNDKVGKIGKIERKIRIEDNSSEESKSKSKNKKRNINRKKNGNNKSIKEYFYIKEK